MSGDLEWVGTLKKALTHARRLVEHSYYPGFGSEATVDYNELEALRKTLEDLKEQQ